MTVYQIGPLRFDVHQGRLFGPDGEVALRAKTLALLDHLADQSGRVVGKQELLSRLWPTTLVSDDALTQAIHELRRALGPDGATRLRTLPRRGYLLDCVRADAARPAGTIPRADASGPAAEATAMGDRVAVMPFGLRGAAPGAARLWLDGLAHDIIGQLGRLRRFQVTGRDSSFALRQDALADATRKLGVDFTISGQARALAGGLRLRIDLTRGADGCLIWSDSIDIDESMLMTLGDALVDRLVAVLVHELTLATRRMARTFGATAPSAWLAFHAGLDQILHPDSSDCRTALALFDRAVGLDPRMASAHAYRSFCHYILTLSGQTTDRDGGIAVTMQAAADALAADDRSPDAHWSFGRALWLDRRPDDSLRHLRAALTFSSSFSYAHYMAGFVEAHHGDPTVALTDLERAETLDPFGPFREACWLSRAWALIRLGDHAQATRLASLVAQDRVFSLTTLAAAAVILAGLGERAQAQAVANRIARLAPGQDPARPLASFFDRDPAIAAVLRDGTRALGWRDRG